MSETTIDPRTLFETEPVAFEDVKEGDFISAPAWSRPRRVDLLEGRDGEPCIFIAEPDESRHTHPQARARCVHPAEFKTRGTWLRFPVLRELYDRAH